MMKLSRFLSPRNELAGKLLSGKVSNVKDSWLCNFTPRFGISTAGPDLGKSGNLSGRAYVDFQIYKGKAALSVCPVLPKFSKIDSGSIVERKGCVMLKFSPAIGPRKYDWQKKQFFALSATEVGSLISLDSAESCEFFHDPSMKSSLEGQVKKSLSVSPLGNDSGYFFNLNVMNSIEKTSERFNVPVTKAEFSVMRTAFSFILPRIMGWDQLVAPQLPITGIDPPKQPVQRINPDFEWER